MRLPSESRNAQIDADNTMVERLKAQLATVPRSKLYHASQQVKAQRKPKPRPLPPQNWRNTGVEF